jgi:hypothetical protein
MKKLAILSLGILFLVGCSQQVSKNINVAVQPQQTSTAEKNVSFSASPGEKFGEMTFAKVENNYATFTGTAEVSGQYSISDLDGNLCFYLDQNSKIKVPDLRNGSNASGYFCFSNKELAVKLLGSNEGKATVKINGYSDMIVDTSQPPYSELLEVISK